MIKASASTSPIASLPAGPDLLSAIVEIDGLHHRVMVDTGASVSLIPEYGLIMQRMRSPILTANLQVQLVGGSCKNIGRKVAVNFRPAGSCCRYEKATFYVHDDIEDIFGFDALIGLVHLKLFDLVFQTKSGQFKIFHQGRLIREEWNSALQKVASIRLDARSSLEDMNPSLNSDLSHLLNAYADVFKGLDNQPIVGVPMRFHTVHQRPIFAK